MVVTQDAGDEAEQARRRGFERWVLPEVVVLYRVALTITAQPADAEDVVQDTLLRAYQACDRFDGAHPRAWLLTILRNANVNRHRRRRPELLDDPDAALERLAATPGQRAGEPEEAVVGPMFEAVVEQVFEALPERFRSVVRLVDIDGLTYAEAAVALGVPPGTVMSRLHRARGHIRSRLAEEGVVSRRSLPLAAGEHSSGTTAGAGPAGPQRRGGGEP